eukprot:3162781-Rhodomonas_salina.2
MLGEISAAPIRAVLREPVHVYRVPGYPDTRRAAEETVVKTCREEPQAEPQARGAALRDSDYSELEWDREPVCCGRSLWPQL